MSPSPPPSTGKTAYLGLGSNLGDRAATLGEALARLARAGDIRIAAVSSLYATAPVGLPGAPEFLNAAARVETRLPPEDLLARCLQVEAGLGRVRTGRTESRTVDLDLLAYEGERRAGPALILPHPRLTGRAFALLPLAEIAPLLEIDGRAVAEWAALADAAGVRRVSLQGWNALPPTR